MELDHQHTRANSKQMSSLPPSWRIIAFHQQLLIGDTLATLRVQFLFPSILSFVVTKLLCREASGSFSCPIWFACFGCQLCATAMRVGEWEAGFIAFASISHLCQFSPYSPYVSPHQSLFLLISTAELSCRGVSEGCFGNGCPSCQLNERWELRLFPEINMQLPFSFLVKHCGLSAPSLLLM